jgi:hypothetical protein
MTIEVTGYDRPRSLSSSTRLQSMDIDGTLTFDPVSGGTRMRWSWDLHPHGALLRLLGPLVAWIGSRNERAIWSGLKCYLESR